MTSCCVCDAPCGSGWVFLVSELIFEQMCPVWLGVHGQAVAVLLCGADSKTQQFQSKTSVTQCSGIAVAAF